MGLLKRSIFLLIPIVQWPFLRRSSPKYDSANTQSVNTSHNNSYASNTLVLFTGDHGQNVGEHNTWTKMTAWEHSLRVPLIISGTVSVAPRVIMGQMQQMGEGVF